MIALAALTLHLVTLQLPDPYVVRDSPALQSSQGLVQSLNSPPSRSRPSALSLTTPSGPREVIMDPAIPVFDEGGAPLRTLTALTPGREVRVFFIVDGYGNAWAREVDLTPNRRAGI
jgi:hypothetical protein